MTSHETANINVEMHRFNDANEKDLKSNKRSNIKLTEIKNHNKRNNILGKVSMQTKKKPKIKNNHMKEDAIAYLFGENSQSI